MALLRVIESLTQDAAQPIRTIGEPTSSPSDWLSNLPLVGPALGLAQHLGGGALDAVSASLHALAHPADTASLAQHAAGALAELARIATLSEDPATPLRRPLSTRKHVAWSEPLPLEEIKAIAHVLDCTVNDVLLSTVAGAFGRHLRRQGFATDGVTIRALVPVNMRAAAAEPALGNRFGLVFANLPLGELNPVARVIAVHRDMEQLKSSSQPLMSLWLLASLGLLPNAIEVQAIDLFTTKATVVISNVPGVQHPLHLAGARIDQQSFWVPQAGRIGVGVSLFTYDGRLTFGVMADRNVLPEPAKLVDAFAAELEELLLCVISLAAVLEGAKSP
jgi:WS/DGAT/MGAT family acyltransferase